MTVGVAVPAAMQLEPAGQGRFRAVSLGDPDRHDVVFGGQLLAQIILASSRSAAEGKEVASIHTLFARAASIREPLEIAVEAFHEGRTVGAQSVTVSQGDRRCAHALVLRRRDEPDTIRHEPSAPQVPRPEECPRSSSAEGLVAPGSDVRVVGGIDTWDPRAPAGPPEICVWVRLPGGWDTPELAQAALAYATDGFSIGAAMRPHAGLGQAMAHTEVATGVLTHTLTFHEPVSAGEWVLMALESPFAGRGRAYGRAHVYRVSGGVVASFAQESMIRRGP